MGKSIENTMHVNSFDEVWIIQSPLSCVRIIGFSGIKVDGDHSSITYELVTKAGSFVVLFGKNTCVSIIYKVRIAMRILRNKCI